VLRLTDAITRDIHFDESLLQDVRADLGERQTVELVATVAGYNLVSRFLEALQIHSHDPR
jgi:alkylhydroperoxidase family enzyme